MEAKLDGIVARYLGLSPPAVSAYAIGQRVSVWWKGDRGRPWYDGTIKEHDAIRGEHLIEYDDGDERWHDLTDEAAHGQLRCDV